MRILEITTRKRIKFMGMEGINKNERNLNQNEILETIEKAEPKVDVMEHCMELDEVTFNSLKKTKGLNTEIAFKLIEKGCGFTIIKLRDNFEGLNYNEIGLKLIENNQGQIVANHLNYFEGLNNNDTAMKLIEKGKGRYVAWHIKEFKGVNRNEIATKLFEAGNGSDVHFYVDQFYSYLDENNKAKLNKIRENYQEKED